jgi:hypothetical protein
MSVSVATAKIKSIRLRLFGGTQSIFSTARGVAKAYKCPVYFKHERVAHCVDQYTTWTEFWKYHQDTLTAKYKEGKI